MVNSGVLRIDKELEDVFKDIARERVVRGIDRQTEHPRRLSKAVARLIKRDLDFQEKMIQSHLEDDRKFRRRK